MGPFCWCRLEEPCGGLDSVEEAYVILPLLGLALPLPEMSPPGSPASPRPCATQHLLLLHSWPGLPLWCHLQTCAIYFQGSANMHYDMFLISSASTEAAAPALRPHRIGLPDLNNVLGLNVLWLYQSLQRHALWCLNIYVYECTFTFTMCDCMFSFLCLLKETLVWHCFAHL